MEVVGSFKHSEVFKKMNFIFPAVGSGGCGGFGGGVIEEEVKFLTPICVLISILETRRGGKHWARRRELTFEPNEQNRRVYSEVRK